MRRRTRFRCPSTDTSGPQLTTKFFSPMRTTLATISASLLALLYTPHVSGATAVVERQIVSSPLLRLNIVENGSTLGVSSSAMFVVTQNSHEDLQRLSLRRIYGLILPAALPGCVFRPQLPPAPAASSISTLRTASCTSITQATLTRSSSSPAALSFAASQVLWSLQHRTRTRVLRHPRSRSTQLMSSLSTA